MGRGIAVRLWFLNLRIGARLIVAFGLCFLLTLGIAWVAQGRMDALRGESARYLHDYLATDAASMSKLDIITLDRAMQEVATGAPIPDAAGQVQNSLGNLRRDAHLLQKRTASQAAQAAAKTLLASATALTDGHSRIEHLTRAKKYAEATRLWHHEMEPQIGLCLQAIDSYLGPTMSRVQTRHEASVALFTDGRRILAQLCGFAFCLSAIFAFILTHTIKRGLDQTTRRLERFSRTDLPRLRQATEALAAGNQSVQIVIETPPLQWEYRDEFGALAASLNQCIAQTQRVATACTDIQAARDADDPLSVIQVAA